MTRSEGSDSLSIVDSQTRNLPGLGATETDLIRSIDHHASHLLLNLQSLLEELEDSDQTEIDGLAVHQAIANGWSILRTFEPLIGKEVK